MRVNWFVSRNCMFAIYDTGNTLSYDEQNCTNSGIVKWSNLHFHFWRSLRLSLGTNLRSSDTKIVGVTDLEKLFLKILLYEICDRYISNSYNFWTRQSWYENFNFLIQNDITKHPALDRKIFFEPSCFLNTQSNIFNVSLIHRLAKMDRESPATQKRPASPIIEEATQSASKKKKSTYNRVTVNLAKRLSSAMESVVVTNLNESFREKCLDTLDANNGSEAGEKIEELITKFKNKKQKGGKKTGGGQWEVNHETYVERLSSWSCIWDTKLCLFVQSTKQLTKSKDLIIYPFIRTNKIKITQE